MPFEELLKSCSSRWDGPYGHTDDQNALIFEIDEILKKNRACVFLVRDRGGDQSYLLTDRIDKNSDVTYKALRGNGEKLEITTIPLSGWYRGILDRIRSGGRPNDTSMYIREFACDYDDIPNLYYILSTKYKAVTNTNSSGGYLKKSGTRRNRIQSRRRRSRSCKKQCRK